MDNKCEYFVVSIDAADVPRIVFGPSDEEVHIMCKHHPVMQSLRAPN
jgi:ribosomal protein L25 (general stress protein Ctc)